MSQTSPPTETPSPDAVRTLPPLPELSLAPQVLDWCSENIRQPDGPDAGDVWRFTTEQRRFLYYLYAVDHRGRFVWNRAVLRRAKGWGKTPLMAAIALAELCGPVRCDGFDAEGLPVAREVSMPWVQIAGVSEKQTVNTMSMVLAMIAESPIVDSYGLDPGLTRIFTRGGGRLEPITASAPTAEGARPSFVVLDETHHWMHANGGHKFAEVIRRNLGKSRDGAARSVETTNAHQLGMDSVAEVSHNAWVAQQTGQAKGTTILYDSLEAPPGVDIHDDAGLLAGLELAYGDSSWVDLERIRDEVQDFATPPSESRRFYLNQLVNIEDAWVAPHKFDELARADIVVADGETVVLFFDGSKSDDATGLVGCRLSDGHIFTVGMWQRPPGERGKTWLVPRADVDETVIAAFERWNVVGFFADPSHAKDDESAERFWDGLVDQWASRYEKQLKLRASKTGHAVMWDMTSPARTAEFVLATERCLSDINEGAFTHDGDPRLRSHVHNALRLPTKHGVAVRKPGRESPKKIDLAVCMIGARMVRRLAIAAGVRPRSDRTNRRAVVL